MSVMIQKQLLKRRSGNKKKVDRGSEMGWACVSISDGIKEWHFSPSKMVTSSGRRRKVLSRKNCGFFSGIFQLCIAEKSRYLSNEPHHWNPPSRVSTPNIPSALIFPGNMCNLNCWKIAKIFLDSFTWILSIRKFKNYLKIMQQHIYMKGLINVLWKMYESWIYK